MTNEEINALTDPQINVMMTVNLCGLHDGYKLNNVAGHSIMEFDDGDSLYSAYVEDYCNNPSITMKIAESQGISIVFDSVDTVSAIHGSVSVSGGECLFAGCTYWQEPKHKYCRAAAIVYLKMKGVL